MTPDPNNELIDGMAQLPGMSCDSFIGVGAEAPWMQPTNIILVHGGSIVEYAWEGMCRALSPHCHPHTADGERSDALAVVTDLASIQEGRIQPLRIPKRCLGGLRIHRQAASHIAAATGMDA